MEGRAAIVTGGASGIGRAACLALAKEGADVVVVDLNQEDVRATVEEIERESGRSPLGLVLNVCREQDMDEMAVRTLASFGRIDILVACAGILRLKGTSPKPLVELTTEEWDAVLDTNLKGTFLANRAVLPAMLKQRYGHIINISSTYGKQGRAYDSAYCASKFGIIGLTEALAEEVRPYRVKVALVVPDAVDTPLWNQNGPIPRPGDALPAARVADLIIYMLTLPEDTVLLSPTIIPFRTRHRSAGPRKASQED
jgi:NAD(P)-dependent dehydrogenase (short-subunit alcohol dehydrogenase family)